MPSPKDYLAFIDKPFEHCKILLNADLGEGCKNDEAIMAFIHAANIACGGHAGNDVTMPITIKAALKYQLIIGAHPSYPDIDNFGRVSMINSLSSEEIIESSLRQIDLFAKHCNEQGAVLRYIKPHGALYHDLSRDRKFASIYCSAIKRAFPAAAIMGFAGSAFLKEAQQLNIETWPESFIDRQYHSNGELVDRMHTHIKPILDKDAAIKQALSIQQGWVLDDNGNQLNIDSNTLCVHGDTETALEITKTVSQILAKNEQA